MFNSTALDGDLIIVVEGEIDAMTLFQCGVENVVGTCGAANFKTLLREIDNRHIEPGAKKFVILFDDDANKTVNTGRTKANELQAELTKRGFAAVVKFLPPNFDANKILTERGELELKSELKKILETSAPELEKIEKEISDGRAREEKNSGTADNHPETDEEKIISSIRAKLEKLKRPQKILI